jgi:RNA polymerase sigma-70 factor (ECF subfamily)
MPDEEQGEKVVALGATVPDPEERALARERSRLVVDSIRSLDRDHRVALVLRDVNGMAYEEIASVLRVPLGTVKSRIARARAQVQERLLLYPEVFGSVREAEEPADA